MISFKDFITEEECDNKEVTQADLDKLEAQLDKLFARVDIDIEFTRHFKDRVNDERNRKQITVCELRALFSEIASKFGKEIAKNRVGFEAVLKDISSDINVPFALGWNSQKRELELIAKTTMRKKNFQTSNKKYVVKS